MVVEIKLAKDAASCCGCGACLTVCPQQAITMAEDAYGCWYPKIDPDKCVDCGRCVRICQYKKPVDGTGPLEVCAAVGTCDEMVKNSASGGVFSSLAESCLQKGAAVAGAVMDCENSHADVYHLLSDRKADMHRMQGSKYVHSEAWRCYPELMRALKDGKPVFFSGTPCQVAAVRALTGDPEHLVTADIICHGVPPVKMLNEYLEILSGYLGGDIQDFRFRDKACSKQYTARMETRIRNQSKRIWLKSSLLSFYTHFLKGTLFRENCYACPYAGSSRVSDITIGDYWGIGQFHGEQIGGGQMPDRADWSCVLVNTPKGVRFLEEHGDRLALYPSRLEWAAENNQQLKAPVEREESRDLLLEIYRASGYKGVEAQFVKQKGGKLRFIWRMHRNIAENSRKVVGHENQ